MHVVVRYGVLVTWYELQGTKDSATPTPLYFVPRSPTVIACDGYEYGYEDGHEDGYKGRYEDEDEYEHELTPCARTIALHQ